jgi:hypothetical protein
MNLPIKINITDERRYTDVAFLVDRDDFLNDLLALRKVKKMKEEFPYGFAEHWALDSIWGVTREQLFKYNDSVAPYEDVLQNTNKMAELSINERNKLFDDYKKVQRILPGNAFEQDIQDIRRKFHKPKNFDRIIAHAVLYGEIRDEDYVTTEIDIDYPEIEFVDYDKEARPVIVFYPLVQLSEIEELLKDKADEILQKYQKNVLGGKLITYDTRPNIERDRGWYWKKRSGLSYSKIHKQEAKNISRDAVIKAIQQYRQALSVEL